MKPTKFARDKLLNSYEIKNEENKIDVKYRRVVRNMKQKNEFSSVSEMSSSDQMNQLSNGLALGLEIGKANSVEISHSTCN